jgi:hypothetical protein
VHAFTQKSAGDDPSRGVAYNAAADRRSWRAMQDFFAEIDDKVEDTGEFTQELLDETEDFDTQTLTPPEETEADVFPGTVVEETAAEQTEVEAVGDEAEESFFLASEDELSDLRTSIASLGVEINDSIIDGVLNDVNSLRQTFMTRPVEKMLLELTSTIVQHIGQYGYESSAEAHGLLLSVFDKLEQVQDPGIDTNQRQELVLSETSKVLLWQQSMLDRQAIKKGDQLTFMDPLRSETAEVAIDEPFAEESSTAAVPLDPDGELSAEERDKELGLGEIAEALSEDLQADEGLEDDGVELDSAAAEFIKKEMMELKESLRAEIEALRDQLKDKE